MKKFIVLMLAVVLVVAFAMPASALENIFGGYWRTRMYQQRNFAGDDGNLDQTRDAVLVDTRTRLYYTAKINDNLKLVNKFEMDTVWGSAAGYGRVGTDAIAIEIKNTYADFNLGPVNMLVGAQPFTLARGFISDDHMKTTLNDVAELFLGMLVHLNYTFIRHVPMLSIHLLTFSKIFTNDTPTHIHFFQFFKLLQLNINLIVYLKHIKS